MNMRRKLLLSLFIFLILGCLPACTPVLTSTPYYPPTPEERATPPATPTFSQQLQVTIEPLPTDYCSNEMTFLGDLPIPDGSIVVPGSVLDKQWQVKNSGTCNWDNDYRLRFMSGSPMGAAEEQSLFPARAGSEAIIRIVFTAPSDPGEYISIWQVFDPAGFQVGDGLFIKVTVQP